MIENTNTSQINWLFIIILFFILGLVLFLIYFYIKKKQESAIKNAKDLVMLKVLIPYKVPHDESEQRKDFRELISVAEQFLSSFSGLYDKSISSLIFGQPRIVFEIVSKNGLINFYVGGSKKYKTMLEKQIHGFYPDAQIEESSDFKIFEKNKKVIGGGVKLSKKFVLPIKTYKILEGDAISSLIDPLSKLGEGSNATLQIIIRPTSGSWSYACQRAAKRVQEGKGISMSIPYRIIEFLSDTLRGISKDNKTQELKEENTRLTPIQEETMKHLQEKSSKIGFDTQIKVVVTGNSDMEVKVSLDNILNSFNQYQSPDLNGFNKIIPTNQMIFLTDFVLRNSTNPRCLLNTEELASIFHLPNEYDKTPNINWLMSKFVSPPVNLPEDGIVIGESVYRGEHRLVRIKEDDRRRHFFMIGKTGVGKTTLFEYMVKQDIEQGRGFCYMDPNGDAIEHILKMIPKERAEDVVLFDPSDTERPFGLNLLEWKSPEEKDFLVAEWIEIFYKLFDPQRTGMVGPQFEHWGRNASLTVMSLPEGGTLIDIPRLFTDDAFRDKCLMYLKDPVVDSFWKQQMAKTADFHKSEMFNYFISKFGRFMTNDLMRNIIGQTKSAFNIREIMDQGKILLVNLSKGKIGESNSYLLGMILVAKMQVAAFSRTDTPENDRRDFYLYVDEFQNFTTDTFKTILSEARKYHLALAITNQYIAQLTEPIRDAVIGNVGTLIAYRIGASDAEFITKEFPGVEAQDITNLDKYNTYVKLLIDSTPSKPFSMKGLKPDVNEKVNLAEAIRQLSRLKFGRDKNIVEEEMRNRTSTPDTEDVGVITPRESEV